MSGHSKWSTIKRKKGAADQKRGKMFTRCIHEIGTAVKEGGGGDASANPRLRFAIDRAKAVNMPNDTIERAIKRATGEEKGDEKVSVFYEGYGPGGIAVLAETLTENKNRTVSEVRHAFSRAGGSLGETGCVNWMFNKKGVLLVNKKDISEDSIMEKALEAGADDVADADEFWEITCEPGMFTAVHQSLSSSVKFELAEVQMIPSTRLEVRGKEAEQMERLIDMLEDLDDVLNVYTNCDFVDE